MAFIADLHSCYYGEGQKELLDCINKHAPDIILFGGDIADDKLPHENWMITLEALSNHTLVIMFRETMNIGVLI